MRWSDFILPFCISTVIHICLFFSGNSYQDIEIAYGRETQTITIIKDTQTLAKTESGSKQEVKETKVQQEQANSAQRPSELVIAPLYSPLSDTSGTEHMISQDVYQNKENRLPEDRQVSEYASQEPEFMDCEIPSEEEPVIMNEASLESANEEVNLENADTSTKKEEIMIPAKIPGLLKPPYPRYSRRYGEEGTVLLSMEVRANGKPGRIEIISSSGYSRLDHAALRAIKKATLIPASINGKAISSTKQIAITFELSK